MSEFGSRMSGFSTQVAMNAAAVAGQRLVAVGIKGPKCRDCLDFQEVKVKVSDGFTLRTVACRCVLSSAAALAVS